MNDNAQSIYTILGFAQKAGKIHSGEETVLSKLNKKSASLLLVAEDAPIATKDKMERSAGRFSIAYVTFGTKAGLGLAIGKSPRNAILVMDRGFAGTLLKYLKS